MQNIKHFMAVTLGVTVSLLAASLLTGQSASAVDKKGPRAFYLTTTEHTGDHALTACAAGFHMASLWEIRDPSNLTYDATLGHTAPDSGSGPPSDIGPDTLGWVRTGMASGNHNCNTWMSAATGGTVVGLPPGESWELPVPTTSIRPWFAVSEACSTPKRVWCVED